MRLKGRGCAESMQKLELTFNKKPLTIQHIIITHYQLSIPYVVQVMRCTTIHNRSLPLPSPLPLALSLPPLAYLTFCQSPLPVHSTPQAGYSSPSAKEVAGNNRNDRNDTGKANIHPRPYHAVLSYLYTVHHPHPHTLYLAAVQRRSSCIAASYPLPPFDFPDPSSPKVESRGERNFPASTYLTFVPLSSSLASLGNLASILYIRAEEAGCTASIVTSLRRVIESSEPSCRGSSERLETEGERSR